MDEIFETFMKTLCPYSQDYEQVQSAINIKKIINRITTTGFTKLVKRHEIIKLYE